MKRLIVKSSVERDTVDCKTGTFFPESIIKITDATQPGGGREIAARMLVEKKECRAKKKKNQVGAGKCHGGLGSMTPVSKKLANDPRRKKEEMLISNKTWDFAPGGHKPPPPSRWGKRCRSGVQRKKKEPGR